MNNVLLVLVATSMLISLTSVQADERGRSGTDTARHPSIGRDGGADHRVGAGSVRSAPPVRGAPAEVVSPAIASVEIAALVAGGGSGRADCAVWFFSFVQSLRMLPFLRFQVLVGFLLVAVAIQAQPVRFFALGDAPYSDGEMVYLRTLLQDASAQGPPFIIHIGDIKGGSQPCSDARIQGVADLFRGQPAPFLYTPGDNEWTDCHRQRAGARDPLERLAMLRQIVFADAGVLHTGALRPVVPDPAYPENLYFVHDGVLFVLMHVVGSNNNLKPKNGAAMVEFKARAAANRALLERASAAANAMQARALVLAFHANPLFEEQGPRRGFVPVKQDLRRLLAVYSGPVLLIHGDTHRFKFDQPMADADGNRIARFSRLEVPGSPFVAGVWVTVDADATPVFDVQVVYPNALLHLGED